MGEETCRPWLARVVVDRLRDRYEKLRERFGLGGITELQQDADGQRLLEYGLVGLLANAAERAYAVHIHQARSPRWGDRMQHEDRVLLEALRLVTGTSRRVPA